MEAMRIDCLLVYCYSLVKIKCFNTRSTLNWTKLVEILIRRLEPRNHPDRIKEKRDSLIIREQGDFCFGSSYIDYITTLRII